MEQDKLLMREFKEGSEDAFEELIIKYRTSAVHFAERYIHDRYAAEDISQECFAYIYVYKEKYNERYTFKTYLFTLIRNKSIDYIRKISKEEYGADFEHMKDSSNPEEHLIKQECKNMILNKLNNLKDDYKTVIYLIDYEEFSYKETALIMGKSVPQIKILVFRARRKLRNLIEKQGEIFE